MKHFLLLISLFITTTMMAGPVDQETAKQKAINFVANKMGNKAQRSMKVTESGIKKTSNRAANAQGYLHVFNIDGGGYVIVSGDDRTEEILGYSTTGTFDAENIPENMRAFLQEYVDGIQYLNDNNIQITHTNGIVKKEKGSGLATNRATKASIPSLLKTTWDQYAPYSLYCPRSGGRLTLTGCVATAMAQVMGYHKWPNTTTTDIPAYTNSFYIPLTPAGTAIDWANIKNSYYTYNDLTEAQADDSQKAVARLMQLCGQSVMMQYGTGGSSATTALCINALINYFDYDTSAQWLLRKNYSYSEWQDIIYAELAAGRPVLYDGQSAGGGHAFVCDGYDKEDFFHINWGWSGYQDNFFRLRLLNPDDQGAGGSSTNEGYGVDQGAGIGIKKNTGTTNNYNGLYVTHLATNENKLTRTSTSSNFFLTAFFNFANYSFLSTQKVAFQVLNSSNEVLKTINIADITLSPTYYYISDWSRTISLGSDLPNGTYKIVISSKEQDTDIWKICAGCSANYIEFTISGNTLTVGHGYEIVDVEVTADVTGNGEINSPQTVTLQVKNNGTVYRHDLSYKINNASTSYTATYVEVEPGETKSFPFTFTSDEEGTYTLHIYNENNVELTTAVVTIGAPSGVAALEYDNDYQFTPTLQYDSGKGLYYVTGNSVTASYKIKNTGDADYNGKLVWVFWKHKTSGSWVNDSKTVNYSLAAGTSDYPSYTFDNPNDENYNYFSVELYWIKDGSYTSLYDSYSFEFRSSSGGDNYNLTATDLVGNPDLQYNTDADIYYINGTESTFSIDITNTGSDAFSGQLQIEQAIHYAGGGDSWYYKDYPTYPETRNVTIPAGSTQRFSTTITKSTDVTVDMYFVRIGYKGSNESSFETLKYTPNFVFVDATTPFLVFKSLECDPELRWDNDKRINYVYGDKLSASFYITNVGGGAFDGQVKFKYYGIDSDGYWTQIKSATTQSFYVAGESTAVATSDAIEKTDGYPYYTICCYYIDPATGTEIFIRRTSDFEFRTPTTYVIETGEYGCTPEMKYDNATYTSYIEGSKATFFGDIKNIGVEDFSGQLKIVKMYHSTTTGYWNYITSPSTQDITIVAGATKRVYIDIEKLDQDDADLYWLCVYYKGSNESDFTYLLGTPDFEFRASSVILGDANGDGSVNVTDIVATVNYIMEKPSADFNEEAADVNQDGYVNVTDIVGMVNIIMEAASRWDANANKLAFSGKSIMLKNLGIGGKVLFDSLNDEKNNSNDEVGMSDILREGQMKH